MCQQCALEEKDWCQSCLNWVDHCNCGIQYRNWSRQQWIAAGGVAVFSGFGMFVVGVLIWLALR